MRNPKYNELCQWLQGREKVVVAFSGGVDSALVLYAAVDAIGTERVKAITADSASLSRRELENALSFSSTLNLKHEVIKTKELENPSYRRNSGTRCYYCKSELYKNVHQWLQTNDSFSPAIIVDGTNTDDLNDIRPGAKAAEEAGVLHPLVEVGISKADVRIISHALGLSTAEKPAMACLSSRVAIGDEVTDKKLSMIEEAEEILHKAGYSGHRVRTHELSNAQNKSLLARIELSNTDIKKFSESDFSQITQSIKRLGFKFVVMDLEGYRLGGLEVINSHFDSHVNSNEAKASNKQAVPV